jgi:LacI family transcriptional regulator
VETRIRIIGLVVPDLTDTHFAEIARGVTRLMQPLGYTVLISNSEGDAAAERQAIQLMLSCSHFEGLILASSQPAGDLGMFRHIEKHKLPYVLIDRTFAGLEANFTGADDEQIGAAATAHLISRGCRHIAHIRGPRTSSGDGRAAGYRAVLAQHGLQAPSAYMVEGGWGDAAGHDAMTKLLSVNPRLDGVVCFNDAVAVGAIKAVLEAGLEVPYDVEVVGAGNVHYSDALRVPLSTIDLNSARMGECAADLLMRLLQSQEPRAAEKILIPFELVPRESSKAVAV